MGISNAWLESLVIESGNWLITLVATFGLMFVFWQTRSMHISLLNRRVLHAWGWIAGGVALNAGWFAVSRQISGPLDRWHLGMFEYRWLAVTITALFFAHGMLSFIRLVSGYSLMTQAMMCWLLISLAILLGLM
jgi:hypothetical protein